MIIAQVRVMPRENRDGRPVRKCAVVPNLSEYDNKGRTDQKIVDAVR